MDSQEVKISNYEKIFNQFRDWFLNAPQEEIAEKIGASFDQEGIYLTFFGERRRIDRKTGDITGPSEQELLVTERLTIMHHLRYCKENPQEPDKMVPFREIREAAVFERAYEKAALIPLKTYFSGQPEKLLEAGLILGGKAEKYGDASVTIQAFPKIKLTYIFWDGDEEFPPSANILFDNTISQWTHPESVPVLAEIGTKRLIQAAGKK